MENRSRGLVDAVGLAERVVLVDGGVERATLHERANLGHFRGGENGRDRAVHIALLFPLLLILGESLVPGLPLASQPGGASVARRRTLARLLKQRDIPLD